MKSLATLSNLYTTLSQVLTDVNQSMGIQLMTDKHRYSLQKYFDTERSFQTSTVGGQALTLTVAPSINATTGVLTAAWTSPTVQQLVNFSNSNQRTVLFTNGSTAISWTGGITTASTTAISTVGVQRYAIPAVVSKVTNDTITVGQLRYVPAPVMTRNEWDLINTLPYTSDIPNYFFIYNGAVEFWPIPSTTGNIIQFNYKARVPDFSTAFLFSDTSGAAYTAGQKAFDYQNGSLSGISVGSTSITGISTAWNTTGKFPLNVDVSYYNLFLVINAPNGDGYAYPISQFNSDTSLTLALPIINAPSATAATHGYSIGQYPVLFEDFHDMLVYEALTIFFTSIVENENKFKMYSGKLAEKEKFMEGMLGSKSINVDLQATPLALNPNNYFQGSSSS